MLLIKNEKQLTDKKEYKRLEIKELDKKLIDMANSASFNGNRGDLSEESYKSYINEVLNWNILETKKQKILEQLYTKYSKILEYEAQHISVIVAGPAKYNSKKFDKSDKILQLTHEFCEWFDDLKKQIQKSKKEDSKEEKAKYIIGRIKRLLQLGLDPTKDIMSLSTIDNKKFIEIYEELESKFKWRKNSNIYKLYQKSLNGEVKEIKKEIFFEDENLIAFIENDRAYIKFIMRPKRQLIVALKSRKWWWNSYKKAWSTYLERLDKDWVSNISEKYTKYV